MEGYFLIRLLNCEMADLFEVVSLVYWISVDLIRWVEVSLARWVEVGLIRWVVVGLSHSSEVVIRQVQADLGAALSLHPVVVQPSQPWSKQ